jgi:outer membrane protein with beta-barrel domain
MKRKLSILFSVIALIFILSICQSNAQTRFGGFLAFGTEIETLGIGANGEFFITEEISIAPDILYFFPNKTDLGSGEELKLKWFEFNANGHYHFDTGGSVMPYGLAGLNFAIVGIESTASSLPFDESSTEVGLNLGGGADFDIGSNIMPFAEIRFVIGNADQLVLSGGVRIGIN